jgi:hypothetical protein
MWMGEPISERGFASLRKMGYTQGKPAEPRAHVHAWNLYQVDGAIFERPTLAADGFWDKHHFLEDTFCSLCYYSRREVLDGKAPDGKAILAETYDRETFFNYFGYVCPELGGAKSILEVSNPYHVYPPHRGSDGCEKCSVTAEQLQGQDAAYYKRYSKGAVWREQKHHRDGDTFVSAPPPIHHADEKISKLSTKNPDIERFARDTHRSIQQLEGKLPPASYQRILRNIGLTGRVAFADVVSGEADPEKIADEAAVRDSCLRLEGYIVLVARTCGRLAAPASTLRSGDLLSITRALRDKRPTLRVLGRSPLFWLEPLRQADLPPKTTRSVLLWLLLDLLEQAQSVGGPAGSALLVFLLRQVFEAEKMRSRGGMAEAVDETPDPATDEPPADGSNLFSYDDVDYDGHNDEPAA